ncbi:MAG: acyl-CoA dehydrogenase C-terminal domain-containing protein, partial [Marinobacter sp.]|nr:acyl-CoA dehydrogenase C-terminal domain-containing protein [Marinobacter sp.]
GTKGISLFIVPKFLPDGNGGIGERNGVNCGSLEKKMGIKASATCVMNFDEATAFLIGAENEGLNCMFTFMNSARIGTAIQGVGPAELSYQWALDYAKERRSMRALSGKKDPEHVADALIHHADVRRMLLTQKAIAEGGRGMLYYAARVADHMVEGYAEGDEKKADKYDDKLGFLTPILKGFLTELGNEAANIGMQVFGGHGYIREHGMEQIARDTRIATLYEGTTGIQALDLLGRKVLLMTQGGAVREFTLIIANFARKHLTDKRLRPFAVELLKLTAQWNLLTVRIMLAARKDRDVVSAAAHDFLMYSGYVSMAYIWARQAAVAADKLDNGGDESEEFYKAKMATAEFYYERLLPRAQTHATTMLSPSKNLMQLDAENMSFTA